MKEREPAIRAKQGAKPKGPYLRKKKPFQGPPCCNADLYARIKRIVNNEQGLDASGQPYTFRVDAIQQGIHAFRLNNNIYRLHDLSFYVKDVNGHFLKQYLRQKKEFPFQGR